MIRTQSGFAVGFIGLPILEVFEINQQDELVLKGSYKINDENIYGISSLHLSSDEMYASMTVICFNRQSYQRSRETKELTDF